MIAQKPHRNPASRSGFTAVELIISVTVLVTVMTVSTTLFFQTQRIWIDIRQQRIAQSELSNQLDRLTRLRQDQIKEELTRLAPSSICSEALRQSKLTGNISEDSIGVRITLAIDWKRRHGGKPLQLSGWLNPATRDSDGDQP